MKPGRFTLVDYDCLAVPALMGQTNLEVGLPAYQHPGRAAGTTLFPGLDNFSALVIYVALRALAAEPSLWDTFVECAGIRRPVVSRRGFRRAADFALASAAAGVARRTGARPGALLVRAVALRPARHSRASTRCCSGASRWTRCWPGAIGTWPSSWSRA